MEVIFANAARTASTSSAKFDASRVRSAFFLLTVGTVSGTAPKLDVYLQSSPDDGTTWYDFAHFAQVTATATRQAKWVRDVTPSTPEEATQTAALAAGTVRQGPVLAWWRGRAVLAGTNPSFTFSLKARLGL